jgi:DNA-binding LacI/PurR family transcriptional regulator
VEADLTVIIKEHDVAAITEAFQRFLGTGTKFDSVIATTQGKTTIAIKLLKQGNFRIPQDVGVIGFDDTPWSELLSPSLTVISENTYAMGKEAVQLLMERMMKDERVEPRRIVLEDEFILREST